MLKTTKRFLGEIRYNRLSRALLCSNYEATGCNYRFEDGILGAQLWPGNGEVFDADEIDEDGVPAARQLSRSNVPHSYPPVLLAVDYDDLKEL